MRAAIYARVSTERQGRDQTIDSQLDALRRWVSDHGYELKDEHIYIDEGYSGARLDRPALDRLRDAAREGEFEVLGVYCDGRSKNGAQAGLKTERPVSSSYCSARSASMAACGSSVAGSR